MLSNNAIIPIIFVADLAERRRRYHEDRSGDMKMEITSPLRHGKKCTAGKRRDGK